MFKKLLKAVSISLCMTLLAGNLSVSAAPQAEEMSLSKSRIEMKVGSTFHIKSKGDAKVEVDVSPEEASKDILVTAKNKRIVKVEKINSRDYRVSALKKGYTTLKIQSANNKTLSKTLTVSVKGKAKARAMVHLTADNFEKEVVNYKGKVVIDFSAKWCYYCQLLEPIFDGARKKLPEYKFCHVDIDKAPELAKLYEVDGVPVLVLHKDGEPVKATGYSKGMTVNDLVSWLKN